MSDRVYSSAEGTYRLHLLRSRSESVLRQPEPRRELSDFSESGAKSPTRPASPEHGTPVILEHADGREVWSLSRDLAAIVDAVISDDGHVALIESPGRGGVELIGPDGESIGRWNIIEHLTQEEQTRVGRSSCGLLWLSRACFVTEGASILLQLDVVQGGSPPPMYDQGPTLAFRIDTATGELTRPEPLRVPTRELIDRHRKSSGRMESERERAEVGRRSMLSTSRGDAALREFWWSLLREGSEQEKHSAGHYLARYVGTDDDLRSLVELGIELPERPRLDLLRALSERLPSVADDYAILALRERWEPELLRRRAIGLLIDSTPASPLQAEAMTLGFSDPDQNVRRAVVTGVRNLGLGPEHYSALLALVGSAEGDFAFISRFAALHQLEKEDEHLFARLERLLSAAASGELGEWSGWQVILGGASELEGETGTAMRLYEAAVEGFSAAQATSRSQAIDRRLHAEALLRLAALSADAGNTQRARALAETLKEDSNLRSLEVCAPHANRYLGAGRCAELATARPNARPTEVRTITFEEAHPDWRRYEPEQQERMRRRFEMMMRGMEQAQRAAALSQGPTHQGTPHHMRRRRASQVADQILSRIAE